jgi:hypothetical protein
MISRTLITRRKKIIEKHRSEFFKTNRVCSANNPNTNRLTMQLNLVNPVNNVRVDLRAHIALYSIKKIQKSNFNKYSAYLFIILNDAGSSELTSKNNVPIFSY